jgi:hypothetical protein
VFFYIEPFISDPGYGSLALGSLQREVGLYVPTVPPDLGPELAPMLLRRAILLHAPCSIRIRALHRTTPCSTGTSIILRRRKPTRLHSVLGAKTGTVIVLHRALPVVK